MVDLLKAQRPLIGHYWSDYTEALRAFQDGDALIGTGWQSIANLVNGGNLAKVNAIVPPEIDRLVGHLDGGEPGAASELHVPVVGLDRLTGGQRSGGRVVRRGPGPDPGLWSDQGQEALRHLPRHRCPLRRAAQFLDDADERLRGRRGQVCKDYPAWTKAWADIKG